jgi:hemolysin III
MDVFQLREPVSALSHGAGVLLAIPATYLLLRRCGPDRGKQISLLVYGLSLAFCYAASAAYHAVPPPARRIEALRRLDHVGIYILIAGSYTPIAWNLLRGRWRRWTLTCAWAAVASGAAWHATRGILPPPVATGVYLGLGWGAVSCYAEIGRVVRTRALRLILVGGVLYSVGAMFNLLDWPVLLAGVFEAHELFHFFVLAGSLAHFAFMIRVVAPYLPAEEAIANAPHFGAGTHEPDPLAEAGVSAVRRFGLLRIRRDGDASPGLPSRRSSARRAWGSAGSRKVAD